MLQKYNGLHYDQLHLWSKMQFFFKQKHQNCFHYFGFETCKDFQIFLLSLNLYEEKKTRIS